MVDERLAAGAIELRDLIYTAWVKSADPVQEFKGYSISPEGADKAVSARAILPQGRWPSMRLNNVIVSGEMP